MKKPKKKVHNLTEDQLQTLAEFRPLVVSGVQFIVSSPAANKWLLSGQEFDDLKSGKTSFTHAGVTIRYKPAPGIYKLTKQDRAKVEKRMTKVEYGDLYDDLHQVGDDCVKSDIEGALYQLLDKKSFATVLAVFRVATTID